MPSWKKVIVSGSDAILNDITLSGGISNTTGNFTLDVVGDINLDANGADIILKDDGTEFGRFKRDSSNFVIKSATNNKDIIFRGVDDSSTIDALTLDMSEAGAATFGSSVAVNGTNVTIANVTNPHLSVNDTNGGSGIFQQSGNDTRMGSDSNNQVLIIQNDATAITIDTSKNVTFVGNMTGSATGSFGRLEAQTISASRIDVDAGTLAIGGTSINKTVADNIQNTSGTNTGDITLAGGSKDFVQLTNQVITVNQVDLTDDVTGVLPSANLDSDTAHLTTDQTFSGIKTFSAPITASAGVSGSASSTGSFGKVSIGSTGLAQSGSELFEVKGNLGTLFTITDEMSGSIFSANTIAGIPVIEAFSDQTVRLGPLANQVEVGLGGHITSSANISSSATLIGANISSSGDIVADGDVVAYNSSDMRLKNNLKVIEGALDKIDGIAGYEFDWNDNSPGWARERGHDVGVVAQEIEKIHPEIVEERKNGYLGVDYKRLVPLLIQSIKELKQEVEELKKKV